MTGGFSGILTTSQPISNATSPGVINLLGTKSDILSNDVSNTLSSYTTWINYFFPGTVASGSSWSSVFNIQTWGWNYSDSNGNHWVDAIGGTAGDLVE